MQQISPSILLAREALVIFGFLCVVCVCSQSSAGGWRSGMSSLSSWFSSSFQQWHHLLARSGLEILLSADGMSISCGSACMCMFCWRLWLNELVEYCAMNRFKTVQGNVKIRLKQFNLSESIQWLGVESRVNLQSWYQATREYRSQSPPPPFFFSFMDWEPKHSYGGDGFNAVRLFCVILEDSTKWHPLVESSSFLIEVAERCSFLVQSTHPAWTVQLLSRQLVVMICKSKAPCLWRIIRWMHLCVCAHVWIQKCVGEMCHLSGVEWWSASSGVMGLMRIASWYPNFNGSHFGLPPSEIHRMTGLPPKIVWTMTYSHRPHSERVQSLRHQWRMYFTWPCALWGCILNFQFFETEYSKIGCRRTHILWVKARCSYLQAV